jgi:hypothetical protein
MKVEIRKSVSRTINTAQYENVIIKCEIEVSEQVETQSDLFRLQKEVTQKLIDDYKNTQDQVMKELGLEEKYAFVEQPMANKAISATIALTPEEESEIFG